MRVRACLELAAHQATARARRCCATMVGGGGGGGGGAIACYIRRRSGTESARSARKRWVQASSCREFFVLSSSGSILRRRDAGQPAADAGYNGMAATPGARPAVSRGPPAAAGHESYRVCPLFIESITPEHWDACIVHAASIHESHDASSWAPDAYAAGTP